MALALLPPIVAAAYALLATTALSSLPKTMAALRTSLLSHESSSISRNELATCAAEVSTVSPSVNVEHEFALHAERMVNNAKETVISRSSLFSAQSNTRQFASLPSLFASLPPPTPPTLPSPSAHPTNPLHKMKPTYALSLSYDGRRFPGGYEHNPNLDVPTVRGTITDRIKSVLEDMRGSSQSQNGFDGKTGRSRRNKLRTTPNLRVVTAGRTDSGVSAKSNLSSFFCHSELDLEQLKISINNQSQDGDLVVGWVTRVHSSFHATFSTKTREYIYVIPLLSTHAGQYGTRVASTANSLLSPLVGVPTNYRGMSSGKLASKNTVCTLLGAGCWHYNCEGRCTTNEEEVVVGFGESWRECAKANHLCDDAESWDVTNSDTASEEEVLSGECLVFKFKADRFIRRMIRKIVNSVLLEAEGIISSDIKIANASTHDSISEGPGVCRDRWKLRVESEDRGDNDPAPATGLCFWRAEV